MNSNHHMGHASASFSRLLRLLGCSDVATTIRSSTTLRAHRALPTLLLNSYLEKLKKVPSLHGHTRKKVKTVNKTRPLFIYKVRIWKSLGTQPAWLLLLWTLCIDAKCVFAFNFRCMAGRQKVLITEHTPDVCDIFSKHDHIDFLYTTPSIENTLNISTLCQSPASILTPPILCHFCRIH